MLWPITQARGYAGGVEQRGQPVGHGGDVGERGAGAAMVAGQVDRQHAEAVMREVARLQRPHAMVVLGAVDEHGGRQAGVERLAAGVGVGRLVLNLEDHADSLGALPSDGLAPLAALRRASARSSARLLRGLQRALEVVDQIVGVFEADRQADRAFGDAGCGERGGVHAEVRGRGRVDHERTGVADVRQMREQRERFDEAASGGASPRRLKLNTAPAPRGSRRLASA